MQRMAVVAAVALVLALSSPARAQESAPPDASSQLAAVRELVMYANYRGALPAVRAFLERTDLTAQERNAGLEVLAVIDLALRDEAGAREALAQLYARDPRHRLSDADASPVVQSAFARAREAASPITVAIEHAPPILPRRVAPTIQARLGEGADAVHEIRVAYRQRGEQRWTHVVLGVDGAEARGRIPVTSDDEGAFTIEYYLEALAPSSAVLAQAGSPDAPLAIDVPAEAVAVAAATTTAETTTAPQGGGDVVSEPWFWIVIGVVVVGAGVGTGVGVALSSEGPENGSLGSVDLPLLRF